MSSNIMSSHTTPVRLDLKKDEKLDIEWQDGGRSTYSVSLFALDVTVRDLQRSQKWGQNRRGKEPPDYFARKLFFACPCCLCRTGWE